MKEMVDLVSSLSCFQNPTDIIPINGGITNVNVGVTNNNKKYVVRIGKDIPESIFKILMSIIIISSGSKL